MVQFELWRLTVLNKYIYVAKYLLLLGHLFIQNFPHKYYFVSLQIIYKALCCEVPLKQNLQLKHAYDFLKKKKRYTILYNLTPLSSKISEFQLYELNKNCVVFLF